MNRILVTIAVIGAVLLSTACKKSAEEQLIGTWKIESIVSSMEMDEVAKEMFKQTNDEIIKNSAYTFEKEGKMKFKMNEELADWKWTMSEDGKSINFTDAEGSATSYTVKSITDKELILEYKIAEGNIQTSIYKKQ